MDFAARIEAMLIAQTLAIRALAMNAGPAVRDNLITAADSVEARGLALELTDEQLALIQSLLRETASCA